MSATAALVGVCVAGVALIPALAHRHDVHTVRRRLLGAVAARSDGRAHGEGEDRAAGEADVPSGGAGPAAVIVRSVTPVLRAPGRHVRRRGGRPPDPTADLAAGAALVIGVAVWATMGVVPGLALAAMVVAVPGRLRRRDARRHDLAVRTALPDAVDLFRLCVGAGLSVHHAVEVVATRSGGPLGDALIEVGRRVDLGVRLADALDALDGLGDSARPLMAALVGAARDGAPLAASLDRVAIDARHLRRRRAEEQARKLPIHLLFPLVVCVLPAFVVLAVVPLLAGSLPSLALG